MRVKKKSVPQKQVQFFTKNHNVAHNKSTINAAIILLAKKYKQTRCFVIDDPSSKICMQTSFLIQNKIPTSTITSISSDSKIQTFASKFAQHNDKVVHGMTTDYLKSRIGTNDKYDMAFLDYCDTPSLVSKKYIWIEDIQLLFNHFLTRKGMIHVTFSVRGFGHVHTFVQYMLDQNIPDAQIVGPYDYRDTQNMIVFTIIRHSDWSRTRMLPFSIGRAIIPRRHEAVLVQMDDGTTWEGQFVRMINSKVWEILDPEDEECYHMDKDMVRRLSLIL